MSEWYSIEVFDGASSAALWAEAHGDPLLESALSSGARDWSWHHHSWGVVLELEFADTKSWDAWRAFTLVQAALDAVPDPISGLIVYRGRGGYKRDLQASSPSPAAGEWFSRSTSTVGMGERRARPAAIWAEDPSGCDPWSWCWERGARVAVPLT